MLLYGWKRNTENTLLAKGKRSQKTVAPPRPYIFSHSLFCTLSASRLYNCKWQFCFPLTGGATRVARGNAMLRSSRPETCSERWTLFRVLFLVREIDAFGCIWGLSKKLKRGIVDDCSTVYGLIIVFYIL